MTIAPWATAEDIDCGPCFGEDAPTPSESTFQVATDILFQLSKRRFPGIRPDVIRPQTHSNTHGYPSWPAPGEYGYVGPWEFEIGYSNWAFDSFWFGAGCCHQLSVVKLPVSPVASVTEVRLDGVVLDPSRYRLDNANDLVYLPADGDARRSWPCCQRLDLDVDEANTFQVSYTGGRQIPEGAKRAALTLACELTLACAPSGSPGAKACQLPQRVQTITRQGVTMALLDPLDLFSEGKTGVPSIDLWLGSLDVGERSKGPVAFRPGSRRRQSWRTPTL